MGGADGTAKEVKSALNGREREFPFTRQSKTSCGV